MGHEWVVAQSVSAALILLMTLAGGGWAVREVRRTVARAKARTRAVFDATKDCIIIVDDDGTIADLNQETERVFGYARGELIGKSIDAVVVPPLGTTGENTGQSRPQSGTGEGRAKDGTRFPVAVTTGSFGGEVAIVLRDQTPRRDAERRLRESEAETRAILGTAVDGVITIDVRGVILSANAAAERIFGYTVAEMVGRNVAMLMPEPYHSAHDGYLGRYLATGERRIIGIGREVEGQRKDGTSFPLDLAVGEADVLGRRVFTGIVRDITERKRTEEALRQSEERLRLLIDNVQDHAITWLDGDGRVVSWNAGAERLYGWSAAEVLNQPMEVFYPPEAHGEARRILAEARANGRCEAEGWRFRKDGSLFWAHVVVNPLLDTEGRMHGFVRVARDITDRKRAEEALRAAKEQAERANIAKSKFLAAASHDMRQPVQALVSFAAALETRIGDDLAANLLSGFRNSLESLNVLLDSLLDISRLEAGIVEPKVTNCPLRPLIERIAGEFAPLAAEKELSIGTVPTSAVIRTDPVLLARMLQNLVANAIRYTTSGRILIGSRRGVDAVRLEVWDTGIGIPAGRTEEIFQEFVQLGNPERDRAKGLGLGLAIVARLSQLLDHPVSVRSCEGKGSVFAITVPLVGFDRPRSISYLAGDVWDTEERPATVLVIDDESMILKGLRALIEAWGYQVLTASSEEEAMTVLAGLRHPPDVILADYRLRAGHTGAEAIRHIRALYRRSIPSVIITGDTDPRRLREAEAHGLRLLHKPVPPSLLQRVIADHIERA